MLHIVKKPVDYADLKFRLLNTTWMVGAVGAVIVLFTLPKMVMPFIMGVIVGYGYLFSLFMSAEVPQRKLSIALSIIRMATVSFLIAWLGGFGLLNTCVVFCGFLSYKVVLVLESVRHSVGITLNRGK